jgi:hypothetical protein
MIGHITVANYIDGLCTKGLTQKECAKQGGEISVHGLFHLLEEPKDEDGTYGCGDDGANPTAAGIDAKQSEEPTTYDATNDTKEKVDKATLACTIS